MKKILSIIILSLAVFTAKSQTHQVSLETPGYSGLVYLIYYYGKNLNIQDSAMLDPKGKIVFRNAERFQPGIYAIVFPGKQKLLDFLIDKEPVIQIKADTSDLINKTVITGSSDNQLFLQYQKFIASKSRQLQEARQGWISAKTKADSVTHEANYNRLNQELNDYRINLAKQHPEAMLTTLFQSMKEPALPKSNPRTRQDSLDNYTFYKKHYWDGISFMDERVIRTPFFLPKLEKYFREVVQPQPDSIIKDADYMLLLARSNSDMYKFLLNWLTDEYIYPKYMGQDAVFVHLFEKYHSKGVSKWLNEKQMTAITNRAYMVMSNLIGEKAANLDMLDVADRPVNLYDVKADFTVIAFWDPSCGHCREEIPRLDSFYRAKWKGLGVKVFAVVTEQDRSKWKEFIKEHKLEDWTHVYQSEAARKEEVDNQRPGYRQLYDITQTPTLYLLDKEKRIIAKKLTLPQMDELLDVKIKNTKASN